MRVLALAASLVVATALLGQSNDDNTPAKPRPGNASPVFPPKAWTSGFEGAVAFRAQVTEEGAVASVEILSTPAPGVGFEEAVRDAVSKWHFDPARQSGRPVPSPSRAGSNSTSTCRVTRRGCSRDPLPRCGQQ
jgi:TonB family protein